VEIRPWRSGDDALALAAQPYLSAKSLANRFLAGTGGRLPAMYLRHVAAGIRPEWDAQVAAIPEQFIGWAAVPGHLAGWAEFGRMPGVQDEADLAVLVADPWHRQGVASALIRALLPRVIDAGVRHLHADVLPGNIAARALLTSLFGTDLRSATEDGVLRYDVDMARFAARALVMR
jgi:GNAT superfamily N-acetyltransferase